MEQLVTVSNERLGRDLKKAAATLSDAEARYLVDLYYQMQEYRKAGDNQCRAVKREDEANHVEEPHETLAFFANNFRNNETDIKGALQKYVESKPIGRWLMSVCGIGPVIAAGLLANIDISKAPTAGHIWNFAGLNPDIKWEKGQKRPFNGRLKTLCWKIGESFVKVSNNDKDYYGHIYAERKAYEQQKNEAKEYADQAKAKLEKFNIGKTTEAYKHYSEGMLPPAHIQSRAKRYAVKLFLSHMQQVWWELEYGEKPPKPFAISILGHAHMIEPPNWKNGQLVVD